MTIGELPEEDVQLIGRISRGIKVAELPHGSVVALGIAHGNGTILEIDLRVHADNIAGPLPVSVDLLEELGDLDPERTMEELQDAKRFVEERYVPALIGREGEEVLAGIE